MDTENPINRRYLDRHIQKMRDKEQMQPLPLEAPVAPRQNDPAAPHPVGTAPQLDGPAPDMAGSSSSAANKTVNGNDFSLLAVFQGEELPEYMLALPLRDLIARYNGMVNLERHAKILRDLTAADEKTQKIKERRYTQVDKNVVLSQVFSYLDDTMQRILDFPEANADSIINLVMAQGRAARPKLIVNMQDSFSRIIADSKNKIMSELTALRAQTSKNTSRHIGHAPAASNDGFLGLGA
jgi:hypothetical protein